MRQVQQVTDAYEYCRQLTQRASKTFYWGSLFLPQPKRQAVWAIYAFCRMVDDIVDEEVEASPAMGHLRGMIAPDRAIDGWRKDLTRLYEQGAATDNPILQAWEHMLGYYAVPLKPALDLLSGVEMDLHQQRYVNFEELYLYCYRVAGTVGLLTSPIFGYEDDSALKYAVDLGIALQLTNILRDIGEDARRDRIYLPLGEMEQFGYREDDLLRGIINDAFRELVCFQMERADHYYQRAIPGVALLEPDCRLAVRLSGTLYRCILDRIRSNDFDVFSMRASVPLQTKVRMASTYWLMQQVDPYVKGLHCWKEQYQDVLSSHR
ncbi:phytoene desaturase [Dictyobacter sp. S3.2.2.5]|uniref:Phytoene desaturase n=1 Tax=Dictyobacter halimunensis TaxID=3026934 RepID=A0ABQ6G2F4_9CHLR|nr:phytoene desaturase [Dictyobacter sp. S3.2.2.5]